MNISPLAAVDPRARIGDDVSIGPFSFVGPDVVIGPGTKIENNVTVKGRVTIGAENHLHPNVVIGGEPQDISYKDEPTEVVIGDNNTFHECVTVNRGTTKDRRVTTIGNDCLFMANSHIAHDCCVGNRVVIANGSCLGGHVNVQDFASISGLVCVHHFASIGSYAFVSGLSRVLHDVPPFMLVEGAPTRPRCVNVVALKRNGFSSDSIDALASAHRFLYRAKVGLDQAREMLRAKDQLLPPVNFLLDFIQCQQEGRHGRARDIRRAA